MIYNNLLKNRAILQTSVVQKPAQLLEKIKQPLVLLQNSLFQKNLPRQLGEWLIFLQFQSQKKLLLDSLAMVLR